MKYLVFLAFIVLTLSSCRRVNGSGNIIKEKKEVGNFTGISAGSAFEVEVHIGNQQSVEIEADDNIMQHLRVKVVGNTLRLNTRSGIGLNFAHIKAIITVPGLDEIEGMGAANITVMDELKNTEKISLQASGAARIKLQVDAPSVDAESSGAGSIEISGKTREMDATASVSANILASGLKSENAEAKATGAGSVHVYASVTLAARVSGAGTVEYSGGAVVNKQISGAGNINKAD